MWNVRIRFDIFLLRNLILVNITHCLFSCFLFASNPFHLLLPSVLFLSICPSHPLLHSVFPASCIQLNDLRRQQSVIFIVATNRLRSFDAAVTRPGRFDFLLFVGTPNLQSREKRLESRLEGTRMTPAKRLDISSQLPLILSFIYHFAFLSFTISLYPTLHLHACS
jgi:hypothetical protein